jgi:glycolate oxidase FAD binding subunit
VTAIRSTLGKMFGVSAIDVPDAPEADLVVAPTDVDQVARLFDFCSEHGLVVLPWGAGLHQGFGGRVQPDVIVSTSRLAGIRGWEPDDLTVVVGAGTTVGELERSIGERSQSAVLPEAQPEATVGGVIAAGMSGWRRCRYGPTRDRILQVEVVTGDGRVVVGGARVVKNVTGYDLPKLFCGSFGSLGLVTGVCLKLWPDPDRMVTVSVDDPVRAFAVTHRPQAVLSAGDGAWAYLGGTDEEVVAEAELLGGTVRDGFAWPELPSGGLRVRLRVPPDSVTDAIQRLGGAPHVAVHGVGEILAAIELEALGELRAWAEMLRGAVVIEHAAPEVYGSKDPWGTPPETVGLQRRIKSAFDPLGVMVPGRLPGGI